MAQGESNGLESLWENRFYKLLTSTRFLPNSPTLVNAGTGRGCLSACFVVTPDDNMESIMEVAHDAAMIEKWGGGIGFGLSRLRPRNDMIKTTHGNACGPIAVMKLYSAVGATLTQGAFRLGGPYGTDPRLAPGYPESSYTARTTTTPSRTSTSPRRLQTPSWRLSKRTRSGR